MGHAHAQRRDGRRSRASAGTAAKSEPALDDRTAEKILDAGSDGTDAASLISPILGIRNALLASAAFWAVIALVVLYLFSL